MLYTKGTTLRGVEGVCNPVLSLGLHPEATEAVQDDFRHVFNVSVRIICGGDGDGDDGGCL